MSTLERGDYTRAPKRVIRLTEGNGREGPEVAIEISGSPSPKAVAKQEAWARKIAAADEMEGRLRDALHFIVTGELPERLPNPYHLLAEIRAALALLDPPTTTVDGAATGAAPTEQENHP